MKCVICSSEDVPMVGESYASHRQIPFIRSGAVIGRFRIAYPRHFPLCHKCRNKVLESSLK